MYCTNVLIPLTSTEYSNVLRNVLRNVLHNVLRNVLVLVQGAFIVYWSINAKGCSCLATAFHSILKGAAKML
jgi:hypothetical protein